MPLPARGGEGLVRALFEPLGWTVDVETIPGPSTRYVSLSLRGTARLFDLLNHLYVLIPVLDDDKHYYVGEDEVTKLLARGEGWLERHPSRELIVERYLKHRRALANMALARLAPEAEEEEAAPEKRDAREDALEQPIRLNDARLDAVVAALQKTGAKSVVDLGCGEGKLLARLARERVFGKLVGLDASVRSLEYAAKRLNRSGEDSRVTLLHGALTYRDKRIVGMDAATLVEVIEHLDPDRLPALARVVFGEAQPKSVIVTTPNAEYNALFPNLAPGAMRHPDHRFEWTRDQFRAWLAGIEEAYGYQVALSDIGAVDEVHGAPTQMAVLTR